MKEDFYYIDKTDFISEVLKEYVTFYTRPRRFGKTLNMSMLYHFFSNKEDGKIFEGLNITHHKEAMKHMNQYPVIFMTLKDMKSLNMQEPLKKFSILIREVLDHCLELLSSPHLDEIKKDRLKEYYRGIYDLSELQAALSFLCTYLKQHYGKNTIILIDEYDVPL